jgi:hypothetical protein
MYPLADEWITKCGMYVEWNIVQLWKERTLWHMLQHDKPQWYYYNWNKPEKRRKLHYSTVIWGIQSSQSHKDKVESWLQGTKDTE